jgi:hypothetical protein
VKKLATIMLVAVMALVVMADTHKIPVDRNDLTVHNSLWPDSGPTPALLDEDFESPVVSAFDLVPPAPPGWINSTAGFGATRCGLDNKDGGDWDVAGIYVGNEQGWAARYTNSGLITETNEVETIDVNNAQYTVSFDVIPDKRISLPNYSAGTKVAYNVRFMAVTNGASRIDLRSSTPTGMTTLNALTGNVATNDVFTSFSFIYTTDPVTDAGLVGQDLAVFLKGATSGAIVDNVKVTVIR